MAWGWKHGLTLALWAALAGISPCPGQALDAPPVPPPSSEPAMQIVDPGANVSGVDAPRWGEPFAASAPYSNAPLAPQAVEPLAPVAPAPSASNPISGMTGQWPVVPYYSQLFGEPAEPPVVDPNLENRGLTLGWFAKADVGAVLPFIHSGLNSGFALPGAFVPPIQTPIVQPGLSAMPRFELAYRFGQGMGELVTSFRFISAQGTGTDATFDAAGAGRITSRLSLDTLDVDYAATEFLPVRLPRISPLFLIPGWLGLDHYAEHEPVSAPLVMRWTAGARLASVFFDSQGAGAVVLNERVMNNFVGAGLHFSAEFTKAMPWKPLSFFTRFDASGILGDATQSFSRTTLLGGTTSAALRDITTGVPVFQFQGGLSWVPDWQNRRCRLSTGYQYEQWWYLGQTSGSTAGLTFQGMFFRGEWGY